MTAQEKDALTASRTERARDIEDIYPLSPMQQGMLFHALYAPESTAYCTQLACRLRGALNVPAFVQAWQRVIDRNAILRTAFVWEDLDEPLQVAQRRIAAQIEQLDWRELPAEEQATRLAQLRESERNRGFELRRAPLMRLTLAQTGPDAHEFVWTMHHILMDGWSLPIVLREVFAFYEAATRGKPGMLPATRPYRDYIAWLQRQRLADAETFWRDTLAGFTAPTDLPLDGALVTDAGAVDSGAERYRMQETWLSPETTATLQTLARQSHLTISTLAQGAWGVLLSRYNQTDDVVFGATVSGRPPDLAGAESMVGIFINTLPLRVRIAPDMTALELLSAIQAQAAAARQFEYAPLVQVQGWSEVPRDRALFDSIIVFENYPVDRALSEQKSSLEIENVRAMEQTNYPITVVSGVGANGLLLKIAYDGRRFSDAAIAQLLGHLRAILEALPAHLDRPVDALPLLTEDERTQLLREWSDMARSLPGADRRIFQLVEEQAERTPAAPAIIWEADGQRRELTYAELDTRATRVASAVAAHFRAAHGPKPAIAAVFMERSPELVIALLGAMKSGAAYLPLDPAYPSERIAYMLADSRAGVVLTHSGLRDALEASLAGVQSRPHIFCVDELDAAPAGADLFVAAADDPVYVIYTSGSTGAPKGVLVPHRALSNHAPALAELLQIATGDRMLQFISPSFDAAGEEFWPALISGASVVIPGEERDRLGEPLAAFCERHGVTHIHLAAPVWHQWCDDLAASGRRLNLQLKTLLVGGEAPSAERLAAWNGLLPAPHRFINAYGPTEATITSTVYCSTSDATQPAHLPIGKPIPNAMVRVVDRGMRWMPQGAAGELLIGGAGLALGYLNRPELTAERFVELPLEDPLALPVSSETSVASEAKMAVARFYRTGDLVRRLPDGNLVFAGRVDDQVKIRGYRVEPGEIESAVAALPGVSKAAVIARKENGAAPRLVAYIVPAAPDTDTAALAATLRERLPDYMLPATWVTLPDLPLTANGKVDRRKLPAPDLAGDAARRSPQTAEEQLIAGLFSSLLNVEIVGADDSFFDLGGHSLLATRLASRLREVFGAELPLRALFENPTVAGMARLVSARRADAGSSVTAPPIQPLPRGADGLPVEPPPLSFGQQRLWFLDQLEPGLISYNTPASIRLEGELDLAALSYALNEIVRRHEVLRTTFGARNGEPVQIIAAEQPVDLNLEDLSDIADATEREAEALRRGRDEVRRPFDLAAGPLLRVRVFRLAAQDHLAILTAHHIAADGWSLGILISELAALYEAHRRGEATVREANASPLRPLPIQYADYAAWQRAWLEGDGRGDAFASRTVTSPLQAQLDYWKTQLAGLPARLDLPTDRPRPAVQTSNGSTYSFRLTAEQQKGLNALARREGATLYMVLLAAYQTLLSRYSGQSDIAVGSVVASRNRPELEGLIGFFVNTLVFRAKFDGNPSFKELIARARETALGAYAHQDVPFEMLVDAVQPRREMSHTPLFQAALSLQNLPMPAKPLPGLTMRSVPMDRGTAQFDMLLSFTELDNGLGAAWEYNSDLFDRSTIERMARNLNYLIDAALADPDQPVATLPTMAPDERALVLETWNQTAMPFPDDTTIHALISKWAVKTPDAVAAEFAGGGQLSYRELDARANQLARHLITLGVTPGALVGLSVDRSLDMVVGIIGTLKAGAAYLPLDPNYPAERLAFMLNDSGIGVLLTQASVLGRLPLTAESNIRAIQLDGDWPAIAAQPATDPAVPLGPSDLAYCIYTSGSTGRPKGALLTHRGLCNLADEQARRFDIRPGKRVLQFSAFSFDASVWETVMALRSGATLVLAPQETLASGPELLKLLQSAAITTVTLPPSLLALLSPSELPQLETVVAAGERCTNEIMAAWAPGRKFFNAYGPTETTVCATMRRCDADEVWPFGGPPIGGPIANFQGYVVDGNLQPQPIGVPGELLVGGVGVARGYLNRPELTKERFIRVPFAKDLTGPAAIHYRTGDLVRWLPSGELEFIGRIDDQVKVRGFRIELGEIEAVLREHPSVKDAVVAARGDILVGYVIPAGEAVASADLRAFLRQRLPEYMTPGVFVTLDAFPLSPAGKVDRRGLPAPDQTRREATAEYVAPRSETENALAAMCAELLALERVGVNDNFFELGGHSLLATKLIARIRDAFQVELPLRSLFEKPTVAGLAETVDLAKAAPQTSAPAAPAITARSREGRRVSRSQLGGGQGGA